MRRRVFVWVILGVLALGSTTACTGERPSLAAPDPVPTGAPAKQATLDPRAVDLTAVATAVVPMVAIYGAAGDAEPTSTLTNPVASGGPLVFVVAQASGEWLEVRLPIAPAGATGWIRTTDVTVARHNYRAEVRLTEFRLDVYLQGQIVRQIKLAEGRGALPQPGVDYFVDELVQPPDLDATLGAFAFGLSGWGDGATSFTGAAGQLALHAAVDPSTIGTVVDQGSLGMAATDIEDLASFLPLGVPVTVVS